MRKNISKKLIWTVGIIGAAMALLSFPVRSWVGTSASDEMRFVSCIMMLVFSCLKRKQGETSGK